MWVEWREDAVVKEAVVVVVVVDVRSSAAEQLGAGHEALYSYTLSATSVPLRA